jgi:hypothetical protein
VDSINHSRVLTSALNSASRSTSYSISVNNGLRDTEREVSTIAAEINRHIEQNF